MVQTWGNPYAAGMWKYMERGGRLLSMVLFALANMRVYVRKRVGIVKLGKVKSKEVDMTHGPLLGKMVAFTIPIMLSGVLQLLFNAADIIVVGRYAGNESLAAVGSTSSLINLLVSVFMGLSVGANVVVAQCYGSGEKERISKAVHTSITLSLICGVAIAVLGFFASGTILGWMGSPKDVIDLAALYLKIYFLGMPASMVFNYGSAILRAFGNTKTPLCYLSAAGVINVLLNLLLVIRFSMGVAGVAVATVVSQYISAALVLSYMVRDDGILHFDFRRMGIDWRILLRVVQIGVPAGLQGSVFSLSNVVIQSAINSFGSTVVAGNSAAANLEGFVYLAMNSVHQTALTFTGQNYGAGEKKRILKVLVECQLIVLVVGLVTGNLAYMFGKPLLHIYSSSAAVVEAGLARMKYICTVYFLCGMMDCMVGSLRGVGRSVGPMIVSLVGACGLRLIWIATVFQTHHTTDMLYITYPVSWLITLAAHVITFVFVYRRINGKR